MKTDIHPKYFDKSKATCSCGASYVVGSTKDALHVEICSNCHPFYTGTEKIIDTAGRVERFKIRRANAAALPKKIKKSKA